MDAVGLGEYVAEIDCVDDGVGWPREVMGWGSGWEWAGILVLES
jgi:hypothetical protein